MFLTRSLRVFCLAALFAGVGLAGAQTTTPDERLSTPRRTIDNFLKWQNPPDIDMSIASEGFQIDPSLTSERRQELARRLKAVLDGRGLLVPVDAIPDVADYQDEVSGAATFVLYPTRLPEMRLVRVGGRWLFARETIGAIPSLYSETYSASAQYLIRTLPPIFQESFLGMALWKYLGILLLVLIAWTTKRVTTWILRSIAHWLIKATPPKWDERLLFQTVKPMSFLSGTLLLYVFYADLQLPVGANVVVKLALELMIAGSFIWLSFTLVDFFSHYLFQRAAATDSRLDDQLVPMLRKTAKVVAFVLGVLAIVQNYGYSVSSIIAGLGIGGLAVALAAQDTLANFFGSLTIFTDQPFQIGDWVVVDGVEGTVEEVGFRSTRIRTFYDSLVSVPNSSLANGKIDNFGRRQYRRLNTTIGLTYDATPEQIEAFVEGVRGIIKASPRTRKDYYEVHLHGFGDFSVNILLYCFFDVDSWSAELEGRQNLLLEVMRLAEAVGVEFAFPTQTLHMDSFYRDSPRIAGRQVSEEELAAAAVSFGPDGDTARPDGPRLVFDGKPVDFRP